MVVKKPHQDNTKSKQKGGVPVQLASTTSKLTTDTKKMLSSAKRTRIETRRELDTMRRVTKVMGKFLLSQLSNIVCERESWLVTTLRELRNENPPPLQECDIKFENTEEAALRNSELLCTQEFDFQTLTEHQKNTIIYPGAEFRSIDTLYKIWRVHRDWLTIKESISKGCSYPCKEQPSETERKNDLEAFIKRGNHPLARAGENLEAVKKNYQKEVTKGWMIPITIDGLRALKHARVTPIGVHPQWSIDENGNRKLKRRIAHDCSFTPPSGHSINNDIDTNLLEECIYGQCIRRVLHGIHAMRLRHENSRILMSKVDLDAAYRRLHVHPRWAVTSCSIVDNIAYILSRVPFGVSAGPSKFSTVSEAFFDLIYDLLLDESWNPETLKVDGWDHLATVPTANNEPLGKASELIVDVPDNDFMCDGYIDDGILLGVETAKSAQRLTHAGPVVADAIFRPTNEDFDLGRAEVLSAEKLAAELRPDVTKKILGWVIHSSKFRIYLPTDKYLDWSEDINTLLSQDTVRTKNLESTIGRLNHAGHILPLGRYFLNRLRFRLQKCKKWGAQKLAEWDREDLKLWIRLLKKAAQEGVSINHVTFTVPSHIGTTDACEHGIGGYLEDGRAWRWELPRTLLGVFTINLLEFIAAVVNVWMVVRDGLPDKKILCFTDSSSALGWLYHSIFNPVTQPLHDRVARQLAGILLEQDCTLYSQHVPGKQNVIADSLSRDHHIPEEMLTKSLARLLPDQTPSNFRMVNLPTEITSWICSLQAWSTAPKVSPQARSRSKLGVLLDGVDSWEEWESIMISLTDGPSSPRYASCAHLQPAFDEISMGRERKNSWEEARLVPPLRTFVRPFGRTFGVTPL